MSANQMCPSCGATEISTFYELKNVPAHSVLLLATQEEALNYPKEDIILGFCQNCGFIFNTAFDPSVHEYSARYEETQGFSSTFNRFSQNLAKYLIDRYDLRHKKIIEIGCGKGEFLTLLCEFGENRGIGFDPAYISNRNKSKAKDSITFIKDFYSEKYAHYQGDFVCCKMTLEHIQDTAEFVSMVRRSIGDRTDTIVFFQVPDVSRILREIAFWDIYYEHCSYFSLGSLARLFRRCSFNVIDLAREYDDQYLMIEARPNQNDQETPLLSQENDLDILRQDIKFFSDNIHNKLTKWQNTLEEIKQKQQRSVIWGGGSKGVAFLTTFEIQDQIKYAVDITPYKHGSYLAGTGQKIIAPDFLKEYRPDVVFVMNPIYCPEIQQDLDRLGVTAKLIPVE